MRYLPYGTVPPDIKMEFPEGMESRSLRKSVLPPVPMVSGSVSLEFDRNPPVLSAELPEFFCVPSFPADAVCQCI